MRDPLAARVEFGGDRRELVLVAGRNDDVRS